MMRYAIRSNLQVDGWGLQGGGGYNKVEGTPGLSDVVPPFISNLEALHQLGS